MQPDIAVMKTIDLQLNIEDTWQVIERDVEQPPAELPSGHLLLPASYWLENLAELTGRENTGVWIDSDEDVELLEGKLENLPAVGVNFPTFMDGRGFSAGRVLRERLQYNGKIIAIGNVIQDQWFFLKRCGFDAYQLPDTVADSADIEPLAEFSVTYQAAADNPEPLFRRR